MLEMPSGTGKTISLLSLIVAYHLVSGILKTCLALWHGYATFTPEVYQLLRLASITTSSNNLTI